MASAAGGVAAAAVIDGGREHSDFDYREGMPRIPSPVVVLLAAIAAAAPISACNSRPKVEAPDEAIVGEWKCPANGSAVTFSSMPAVTPAEDSAVARRVQHAALLERFKELVGDKVTLAPKRARGGSTWGSGSAWHP